MTATKLAGLSTLVFVAELRTLIITNFLGVRGHHRHRIPTGLSARIDLPTTDVNELRGELLGRDYETYVRMAVLSHYGLTEYDMSNGWHA
ncbi:hypothetical protein N5P37_005697 [Trichoderma harzianum]|nr:hypothetical protein N5P37_005697 [Trichoderma harzianum]